MISQELLKRAQQLNSKGLSTEEIADELKVHPNTVVWLLLRGKERALRPVPHDVFVEWTSLGSHGKRMEAIASALADLTLQSVRAREFVEPEAVVAIEGSGMVLGVALARELGKPLAGVRLQSGPRKRPGLVNPSLHRVRGKTVLVADAVLRAGITHTAAIRILREAKAKPVAVVVLVNKSGKTKIGGIPLKSLIQIHAVTPP